MFSFDTALGRLESLLDRLPEDHAALPPFYANCNRASGGHCGGCPLAAVGHAQCRLLPRTVFGTAWLRYQNSRNSITLFELRAASQELYLVLLSAQKRYQTLQEANETNHA